MGEDLSGSKRLQYKTVSVQINDRVSLLLVPLWAHSVNISAHWNFEKETAKTADRMDQWKRLFTLQTNIEQ